MLVLTRKSGQRIFLPDLGVVVTVVALSAGRVRLGFSAPAGVEVYREEVLHEAFNPAPAARPTAPAETVPVQPPPDQEPTP